MTITSASVLRSLNDLRELSRAKREIEYTNHILVEMLYVKFEVLTFREHTIERNAH